LPTSVAEGFEGTFVPSGWNIENPNNDAQWSLSSNAGGYGNTSKSAIFDNYNNDSQGNSDDLIMHFNPSSISTNPFVKFDVAYARWGEGYSDTLEVLASTDCGASYQSLYMKGGSDLATSPDLQDYFTPNSSQWRTDSVDLTAYANEANLQIAFRNIGRYGNVIYLDNINIGDFATISENETLKPIIYPNPVKAGESITIQFMGEFTGYLIDQKGSKVQVQKGKDSFKYAIPENISSGLYTLQIQTESMIWNERISVIK
jgi:hypothetical protein